MKRMRWNGSNAAQSEYLSAIIARPPRRKKKRGKRGAILPPPSPASWATYAEYLESPWWQWRRKVALDDGKRNRCKIKKHLQVHHRTYERLDKELSRDLEILCRKCHEAHHGIANAVPV